MFHFIVRGAGWTPNRDTIDQSRVLEYTDQHVLETFQPDGALDVEKAIDIPALFVSETGGLGDEVGRVGTINRVGIETEVGDQTVGWNELVLALGAVPRTVPIPGLVEHGLSFKSLADAIGLRNHVLRQLDLRAQQLRQPLGRRS